MFKGTTKLERMQDLKDAGLNTSWFVIVESRNKTARQIAERFAANFNKISIRTFRREKTWGVTPHLPNLPRKDALAQLNILLSQGYSASMAEGIDPGNTIVCGTVWKKRVPVYGEDKKIVSWTAAYVFELAFGPGTVRRVMVDGKVESRFDDTSPKAKNRIIYEVMQKLRDLPDRTIYEWSYYLTKVGWKRQNLIFWEWLPDGTSE